MFFSTHEEIFSSRSRICVRPSFWVRGSVSASSPALRQQERFCMFPLFRPSPLATLAVVVLYFIIRDTTFTVRLFPVFAYRCFLILLACSMCFTTSFCNRTVQSLTFSLDRLPAACTLFSPQRRTAGAGHTSSCPSWTPSITLTSS